ncbi:MAG: zf-HC2 domain-containing protein [Acidobacteria bacterium]|nr:zf-HC2 domain-containing protein [Acidobacteriota bacterium]
MECRAVVSSMSDYIDKHEMWLSDIEVREIETHLIACSKCQSIKLELTEVRTAARELPLHTPSRALWARIAKEIEPEVPRSERPTRVERPALSWWARMKSRQFSFTLPQLAGAGALAAALIVFGLFRTSNQDQRDFNIIKAPTALQTALLPGEDTIKAEIERRLSVINGRKMNWDPQVRDDFERHLNKIEESLRYSRQTLQNNPDDRVQQQMVLTLYHEKRQLLEDVERLKW